MTAPTNLFKPLKLGRYTLPNRILMSPLTRSRATRDGHVPRTDLMLPYYADRAAAGLIITESTIVQPHYTAFRSEPGIYSEEQIAEWKKIVDAVHAKKGLIFLQLFHAGRSANPKHIAEHKKTASDPLAGRILSASAVTVTTHQINAAFTDSGEKEPYGTPDELTDEEITNYIIPYYVDGAKNAVFKAGFDGVEILGATGYLLDSFLRACTNKRQSGPYAGTSIATRCRLMFDVTKSVCDAVGNDRVGLRFSPLNSALDVEDPEAEAMTKHLCEMLNPLNLAYLHYMRVDPFGKMTGDVMSWINSSYKGVKIANVRYEIAEAEEHIRDGKVDAVAFGTKFLANPDLVERIRLNAPLNPLRPEYFYRGDAVGYNDYPKLADATA